MRSPAERASIFRQNSADITQRWRRALPWWNGAFGAAVIRFGALALATVAVAGLAFSTNYGVLLANPVLFVVCLSLVAGAFSFAVFTRSKINELRHQLAEKSGYKLFIDNATDGFFRMTLEGRLIEANDALGRIYGFDTQDELVGELNANPQAIYLGGGNRAEFLSQLRTQGHVDDFISKIGRRDGKIGWVSESARTVYDSSGRPLFLEGTVRDVTVQRETVQAMHKALREAKEAARAKSAFLAAISHELKTPLNSVIGFSEIILQQLFGPIGDRYQSYVEDIHHSGMRLMGIINDVIDMSRIEGGLLEVKEDVFALDEILHRARSEALKNQEDTANIGIATPKELPLLRADPKRILQVVRILLSNAIKFTPKDGYIEMKVYVGPDRSLLLEIIDSGIGMEPDCIAIALEPFKQLDSRLERRFEGIGLGLPLAHALVQLHGGRLAIVSTPGEGTTVNIAFPPERVVEHTS